MVADWLSSPTPFGDTPARVRPRTSEPNRALAGEAPPWSFDPSAFTLISPMRQLGEPEASRGEHMQDPSIEPSPNRHRRDSAPIALQYDGGLTDVFTASPCRVSAVTSG